MTTGTPSGVLGIVRAQDWWHYKIPPLLAVATAGLLGFGVPSLLERVAFGLLTVLAIAAYGFVLNDLTDIEADRASGQPNRMAPLGPTGRAVAVGIPLLLAAALAWQGGGPVMRVLIALNLLVPTLYSVPPFRLKGRGLWGALADAIGVHALPMALVGWTITRDDFGSDPHARAFLYAALAWTFLAGFRNIIVHQARGLHGDRIAQVRTFVASIGAPAARRLVWHWVFPAELVALVALLVLIVPTAPVLLPLLVLYLALEFRAMRLGWTLAVFESPTRSTERYRPIVNNALYEVWLPLGLALQLALVHPWGIAVLVAELVLFRRNLVARLAALRPLFRRSPRQDRDAPWQARDLPDPGDLAGLKVFITTPTWTPEPITWWSADLARGLRRQGVDATILLTEEETSLVAHDGPRMARPSDIPVQVLRPAQDSCWGERWAALYRVLVDASPCALVLTTDWRQSGIVPMLPTDVTVVQVAHADDSLQLEQFRRLVDATDLVVGGSPGVTSTLRRADARIGDRLVTIPHGSLFAPDAPAQAAREALPFSLLMLADGGPAAVHAVHAFADALARRTPAGRLTVLDPDEPTTAVARSCGADVLRHLNRQEWAATCLTHHGVIVADWSPGAMRLVVEAMGHGMVPISWGAPPSGVPFVAGRSGITIDPGSADAADGALQALSQPGRWQSLSDSARGGVIGRHYDNETMTLAFLDRLAWTTRRARSRRRRVQRTGRFTPPPAVVGPHRIFWTEFTVVTEDGTFPDTASAERLRTAVAVGTAGGTR